MKLVNKIISKIKLKEAYAIRLFYIDTENGNIALSKPFLFPEGMPKQDALSMVSILFDKVERNGNYASNEQKVINVWDTMPKYGFRPVPVEFKSYGHFHTTDYTKQKFDAIEGVADLFIVDGEMKDFKQTPFKNRYFNWMDEELKNYQEIYDRMHANRFKKNTNSRTV